MAATRKLNAQERKDLDKFTKFLTYKTVQVIVQSRLGEKIEIRSKPFSSGSDWFNLAIKDLPEVIAECKKAFIGPQQQQLLPSVDGPPLCIEISLQTVDGECMVLEIWSLIMTDTCDTGARITYTVYNRMSILLKSLFCVTRVTPAYKLSRRQSSDMYVICYRLYTGQPQLEVLGETPSRTTIGKVGTPAGTLELGVVYRTKLVVAPQVPQASAVNMPGGMFVQDDHFKQERPRPCQVATFPHRCYEEAVIFEDSQEFCNTTFSASPSSETYYPTHHTHMLHKVEEDVEEAKKLSGSEESSMRASKNLAAFATSSTQNEPAILPDVPFINLLQPEDKLDKENANMETKKVRDVVKQPSENEQKPADEDYVMVELRPPFAATDVNSDLGSFYRQCQQAPPLSLFTEQPTFAETIDNLPTQIHTYEQDINDIDNFVQTLSVNEDSESEIAGADSK